MPLHLQIYNNVFNGLLAPRPSRPTTIRRGELPSLVNPFGRIDLKKTYIGKDLGMKMLRNRCGKCWSTHPMSLSTLDHACGCPSIVRYFFQQYEQERQINLSPGWSFRIH